MSAKNIFEQIIFDQMPSIKLGPLVALVSTLIVLSADSPAKPTSSKFPETQVQNFSDESQSSAASDFGCNLQTVDPVRGLVLGCTFRDRQKMHSMHRRIAVDDQFHIVNFVWLNADNDCISCARHNRYESWDPSRGFLGSGFGGEDFCQHFCGEETATIDVFSNGRAAVTFDQSVNFSGGVGDFRPRVQENLTPGLPDFFEASFDTMLWHPYLSGDATHFGFPKVAVTSGSTSPPSGDSPQGSIGYKDSAPEIIFAGSSDITPSDQSALVYFASSDLQENVTTFGVSANLGCAPNTVDPVRGITLGCSFRDRQKLHSMNRQITTNGPQHLLNFTWHGYTNDCANCGTLVYYESWDPAFGELGSGLGGESIGNNHPPFRFGESVIDGFSDGRTVLALEWDKNFGAEGSTAKPNVFINQTPGVPDYVGGTMDTMVWYSSLSGDATVFKFPKVATTSSATPVTHIVISDDRTDGDNLGLYTRKIGTDAWDSAYVIGTSPYSGSFVITASRQSGRVAIAWSGGRGDGTEFGASTSRYNGAKSGRNDNDVYVITSEDTGATWSAPRNVTQRQNADPGGFAPHSKLTVLFDDADVLHVAWQAVVWPGYSAEFTRRSRMFHWDETNNIVRTAHDAVWDTEYCNGGENMLNTDNPQLSFCNGMLYLTFTEFASVPYGRGDDCAARAFGGKETGSANGDILVTVSSNGGFNWDPPRNLTDTYTPDCDTLPGTANPDCDSDVWHSATRYGIDITGDDFDGMPDMTYKIDGGYTGSDYLFVQYINDADPGAAIAGEGGWTYNPVRAFRFGCVGDVSASQLASSLPLGASIVDPFSVTPGTDSALIWNLENIGTADLNYSLTIENDNPPGNVSVSGATGFISAGVGNVETLSLTLNAGQTSELQNASARIIIDGDFVSAPDTFNINYCICDLEALKFDSLDQSLLIANNGNIGFQNNQSAGKLNMDFIDDPAECDNSAISYLYDGSPVISYNNGHVVTAMFVNSNIIDSTIFRPQSELIKDTITNYEHITTGLFTTQDSTLGLIADYWTAPGNLPGVSGGTWKAVIGRVSYMNLTTAPIDSVFCAYAFDWDVPSDSGKKNSSAITANIVSEFYVYQQGAEFGVDTGLAACKDNSTRYAATIFTPQTGVPAFSDAGSGVMGIGVQALYTRENSSFIDGGGWDHQALDSMLKNINGPGVFSSGAVDSQYVDLHTVLNGGAYRIDPDDTLQLWFTMLTGFGTYAEFEEAATMAIALPSPLGCCNVTGDINSSGSINIADVTYLIAWIFSGGAAPLCCEEADVNGDGKITISDATFNIAYMFSGGAPPLACGDEAKLNCRINWLCPFWPFCPF